MNTMYSSVRNIQLIGNIFPALILKITIFKKKSFLRIFHLLNRCINFRTKIHQSVYLLINLLLVLPYFFNGLNKWSFQISIRIRTNLLTITASLNCSTHLTKLFQLLYFYLYLLIQKIRLFGTANNLYTFTKFTGVDPSTYEVNGLTPGTFGGGYNYYPSAFQFILGLQVSF